MFCEQVLKAMDSLYLHTVGWSEPTRLIKIYIFCKQIEKPIYSHTATQLIRSISVYKRWSPDIESKQLATDRFKAVHLLQYFFPHV